MKLVIEVLAQELERASVLIRKTETDSSRSEPLLTLGHANRKSVIEAINAVLKAELL